MTFLPLRLSSFYITIFFVIGCMLPFWPVWLQARGMNGVEIGILTAIPVLGKVIFSPFFASLGDRLGERKRLMLFFTATSFFCFAAFYFVESFIALFIVSFLYGMSWAPIMSFGDNITLLSTRGTKIQYGRMRLWGSLSFIAMSFGFGFVLEATSEQMIYWAILVSIVLTLCAIFALPDVRVSPLGKAGKPVRMLLKDRKFQLFMATVACIHGSHALYYAFATIHWRSLDYSDGFIGFLWGGAVVAEVIFFLFGGRIATRFAAPVLLMLAAFSSMVRWAVLAHDPAMSVLLIVQTLHAFSFGAMHLGAMSFIKEAVAVDLSATAQSLYGASAFGVGGGVTLLFAGYFYEMLGAQAFIIMSMMGLMGMLLGVWLHRQKV
ncbi:MFS transporter [Terasakiella sp. SH-1]|uniref:MFS transporter n=1 Tax=Terasakiella sp. SH-1 TaxID=2560057 RepID=UPI001073884D|nr:MFS transporter [Terasakiella sp. SH-1]